MALTRIVFCLLPVAKTFAIRQEVYLSRLQIHYLCNIHMDSSQCVVAHQLLVFLFAAAVLIKHRKNSGWNLEPTSTAGVE